MVHMSQPMRSFVIFVTNYTISKLIEQTVKWVAI